MLVVKDDFFNADSQSYSPKEPSYIPGNITINLTSMIPLTTNSL